MQLTTNSGLAGPFAGQPTGGMAAHDDGWKDQLNRQLVKANLSVYRPHEGVWRDTRFDARLGHSVGLATGPVCQYCSSSRRGA